jgi:hypothetical protein
MEADWEVEIGGDAPVIEANWRGFVDIREQPERVREIAETKILPGLATVLLRLNKSQSPTWTCKTDVFTPDNVDPDELGAKRDEAQFTIACYIDLLWRSDEVWNSVSRAERHCRELCRQMHEIPLQCCRIDLVVRRALVSDENSLGATVYFTACGRTSSDARERLAECLSAFAHLFVADL